MVCVWQLKSLHGRSTFKAIRLNGSIYSSNLLRYTYLLETSDVPRFQFAVIVSKRFGSAVRRNQLKRRIREAIRIAVREQGPRGADCVSLLVSYNAKKPPREIDVSDLKKDVVGFLAAIGVSTLVK